MKIYPLSEGAFTIDSSKLFVPFNVENDELNERSKGSLLVEIQPFLIVTKKDILLLDTGLGYYINNQPQIFANLASIGFNSTDVTKILLTHLHKDHAGGIGMKDKFGSYIPSFPNATIYVQQQEYEYAQQTGFPSYLLEELQALTQYNKLVYLTDNKGTIDGYIDYEITNAHSKFHQVFWIKEDGETIFFGGDDAPQLQQMKTKYVAKYDYDGKKCMELRNQWWTAFKDKWTFLFYHDIKQPIHSPIQH